MPNEPKADWEKEAVAFTNRHDLDVKLTLRHRRAVESALADALSSAHAAGVREAEEKRHPGTEPPDSGRWVLGNFDELWDVVRYVYVGDPYWTSGAVRVHRAPDFWLELPDASLVGGKETK